MRSAATAADMNTATTATTAAEMRTAAAVTATTGMATAAGMSASTSLRRGVSARGQYGHGNEYDKGFEFRHGRPPRKQAADAALRITRR
jgi:hypothetical protein